MLLLIVVLCITPGGTIHFPVFINLHVVMIAFQNMAISIVFLKKINSKIEDLIGLIKQFIH